ncbi:MAG: hypothetical protein WBM83_06705, partial [Flavobacteriaceae bacterium]
MKKALFTLVVSGVIGAFVWYFFLKPYDYSISFVLKTSPGTIFQAVNDCTYHQTKADNFQIDEVKKVPFSQIQQRLILGDSLIKLDWQLESISDSTTMVTSRIKDLKSNFFTRLGALSG